jgi:hypothetical protein
MSTTSDPAFHCVTCEAAIVAQPTFHVGLAFCCAGCVADGPCICSYDDASETGSDLEPVVAIDDRRPVTAAA